MPLFSGGLLALAFHPAYASNGRFFVHYTDLAGDVVVSRFRRLAADPNQADANSEAVLLTLPQPTSIHNGGGMAFGEDGFLYVGLGDGGLQGDPHGLARDPFIGVPGALKSGRAGCAIRGGSPSTARLRTSGSRTSVGAISRK